MLCGWNERQPCEFFLRHTIQTVINTLLLSKKKSIICLRAQRFINTTIINRAFIKYSYIIVPAVYTAMGNEKENLLPFAGTLSMSKWLPFLVRNSLQSINPRPVPGSCAVPLVL